jgi:hypothetical protein
MRRVFRTLAVLWGTLAAPTPSAVANAAPSSGWAVNPGATVTSVARAGDLVIAAGNFLTIGRASGGLVETDHLSGSPAYRIPAVAGSVRSIVPDGHGGVFIGGSFSAVGGLKRSNLAHILADGAVAAWRPDPDAQVGALALEARVLYVAGDFRFISGAERHGLAAIDAQTCGIEAWDPNPDDAVRTLFARAGTLYVGGDFSTIAQTARSHLAAFASSVHRLTDWSPALDGRVTCVTAADTTIFVGGQFNVVNGSSRVALAALSQFTGQLLAWNPLITLASTDPLGPGPRVDAILARDSAVFVGGLFDHVGPTARHSLAQVSRRTGEATAWDPSPGGAGPLRPATFNALALAGSAIYVAGRFTALGGQGNGGHGGLLLSFVGALDMETGLALPWNPDPDGPVQTLCAERGSVMIGGEFTSVWDWKPHPFLAAFDVGSGNLTPWNPAPDGPVRTIAVQGRTVYAVGEFGIVGGQSRAGAAALDIETGIANAWDPSPDGPVRSLLVHNELVYLGGGFHTVGGQVRSFLAAVDTIDGTAAAWSPSVNDWVLGLAANQDCLYVGGLFTESSGTRHVGLAALDLVTGTTLLWDPECDNVVDAVALVDTTLYAGGYFDHLGGESRRRLGAVSALSGQATHWLANAESAIASENFVTSLAVGDGAVYAGGGFTSIGAAPRMHLAALDAVTGAALDWAPDPDGFVWAVSVQGDTVYVGGSFGAIDLGPAGSLAALPGSAPRANPGPGESSLRFTQCAPNPATTTAVIRFLAPAAGTVRISLFDLQGRLVNATESAVSCIAGEQELLLRTDRLKAGCYVCFLTSGTQTASGKIVVVH